MCTYLIATLPSGTDLLELEGAIPTDFKLSLLRGGLKEARINASCFGFTEFTNRYLVDQLPCGDQLALMTRLPCDCWTTLATFNTSRRELSRWRNVFRAMLSVIPRFGLIIHYGETDDQFTIAGPEARRISEPNFLYALERDTLYEIVGD